MVEQESVLEIWDTNAALLPLLAQLAGQLVEREDRLGLLQLARADVGLTVSYLLD